MKKIIIILTAILSLSSCERIDFGIENVDPYAPTSGNIDAMLRGAMVAYAGGQYQELYDADCTLYAQYQSETLYTDAQKYSQEKGSWENNYVRVLSGLKEVSNFTNDVRGNTVNYKVISELFSVFVWKQTTDMFGDLAYTESLQGTSNLTPAYDSQEAIYSDLINRAKAARDMIDTNAFTPDADTDIFYGGDMSKWGKLANSMILALTIQLSNTSLSGMAQTEFQNALANSYGVIENNSDNFTFTVTSGGNYTGPIPTTRTADYRLSKELTDALLGNGTWGPLMTDTKNPTSTVGNIADARIAAYADAVGDGLPYGYDTYPSINAVSMSATYIGASSPYTLLSAAYTWLNRAEGSLIYGTGENTNTMFTNGVLASFDAAGMTSFGAAKATERLADVAGSVTMAQVIGEEKWLALFPDGNTAWAEQRRTGFPALHPAPDAINGGIIPHRKLYPSGESSVNPSGYAQGVQGLTPADDKNTSSIWWE